MRKIEFTDGNAKIIYNDYISRLQKVINKLPNADKIDILKEVNSHIFENMANKDIDESEVENLLKSLSALGIPEVSFKQIVADKVMTQAVNTFNPKDIFKALTLNITRGVSYVLFSILYVGLLSFVFLICVKLIYPAQTGLFVGNNSQISFGFIKDNLSGYEVLGGWFIPLMIIALVGVYIFITLLMRFYQKK